MTTLHNWQYNLIKWMVRTVLKKPSIKGTDQVDPGAPAIFVSNHLGSFAPVLLNVFLDFDFIPWVTYQITDRRFCADYIRHDFIEAELSLRPPLSNLLARIIAPICMAIMKKMEAIAIYRGSRKMAKALELSVAALERGRPLLIFPENRGDQWNGVIYCFDSGLVRVARHYYQKCGRRVIFYPVAVNKDKNLIRIGGGIVFDPGPAYRQERERVIKTLMEKVSSMYLGEAQEQISRFSRKQ